MRGDVFQLVLKLKWPLRTQNQGLESQQLWGLVNRYAFKRFVESLGTARLWIFEFWGNPRFILLKQWNIVVEARSLDTKLKTMGVLLRFVKFVQSNTIHTVLMYWQRKSYWNKSGYCCHRNLSLNRQFGQSPPSKKHAS